MQRCFVVLCVCSTHQAILKRLMLGQNEFRIIFPLWKCWWFMRTSTNTLGNPFLPANFGRPLKKNDQEKNLCPISSTTKMPLGGHCLEDHSRTRKWLGSSPFTNHETAMWKGSHNRILRGTDQPWTMVINHLLIGSPSSKWIATPFLYIPQDAFHPPRWCPAARWSSQSARSPAANGHPGRRTCWIRWAKRRVVDVAVACGIFEENCFQIFGTKKILYISCLSKTFCHIWLAFFCWAYYGCTWNIPCAGINFPGT